MTSNVGKNASLLAALQAKKEGPPAGLAAALLKKQGATVPPAPSTKPKVVDKPVHTGPGAFSYLPDRQAFVLFGPNQTPASFQPTFADHTIVLPLAPCVYRLCDYTLAKQEPLALERCLLKLGVLRCLQREQGTLNDWLKQQQQSSSLEEEALAKTRFMELLSGSGVYQAASQLLLQQFGQGQQSLKVQVDGLDDFLEHIEELTPALAQARQELVDTQSVSFYPGLGELFRPGTPLVCFPEGLGGTPLGCMCLQSWYSDEAASGPNQKVKRKFVLVLEFLISVGTELVFVAATDVYPEFHDTNRNVPLKDLKHRRLDDASLQDRLQRRGDLYAAIATTSHFLEYYGQTNANFYPILTNMGWNSQAVRPLAKGGRVMVDVQRGILEGHLPVRAHNDGLADTVKEAIKLLEQSKRTGVAVPFRTATHADAALRWMAWPVVTGFSFTARVWGKLVLTLPSAHNPESRCGSCGLINFQEKAFDQLVLAEDKKELIRAVARNAGGGRPALTGEDGADSDDDEDDDPVEDVGLDVVANKGGASIFLLHGPAGVGKTLTAEAIAELLKKPLYIVTAGDLGTTAAEVEKTLGAVLDLCQSWDALVLIDEADVFLEARTSTEIHRNALVCVMLRLLEYYSGCLFLSSNRAASSIDAAIASRITVMLGYAPLDAKGRAKVWQNLIELVPALPVDSATGEPLARILAKPHKAIKYRQAFSVENYQELATSYELNGRQIKNSIVLARALARERRSPLSMTILHRAVTAVAGERAVSSDANKTY